MLVDEKHQYCIITAFPFEQGTYQPQNGLTIGIQK
jgi:hypothetical protein